MCVYFKNTRPPTVLHRQVGLLLQSELHEAVSNLTLAINVEESITPLLPMWYELLHPSLLQVSIEE
jgi:hypothetical protein